MARPFPINGRNGSIVARRVEVRGSRPGFGPVEALALAGAGVLSLALAWAVVGTDGFDSDAASGALIALGGIAAVAVILAGPVPCLAAIGGLTASGLDPDLGSVGGFDLSGADVFWVGLAGWWLLSVIQRAVRPLRETRPRVAFGQLPAIAFFGFAALTVLWEALAGSSDISTPFSSLLRLLHTVALAWLVAALLDSKRDVRIVLGAIALGGLVAIGGAALSGGDILGGRSGGELGKNELGLVSGLLLLIALFSRWDRRVRYLLGAAAVLGLVLAKSVAAFVALGVAIGIGAALVRAPSGPAGAQRVTRVAVAMGVAALVVFTAIQVFRPEQLPTSEEFRGTSATHRILVGATGIEIFERNAIFGAGWGASSTPEVIGDREVVLEVRRQFPDARPILFPDITPTTVHNMYIQVLAELGLIGFSLFMALAVTIALRSIALLRRLRGRHELYRDALAISVGLLLVLIWHNEAPLYGGQPETLIPVLLIGVLAAIARITTRAPSSEVPAADAALRRAE